MSGLIPVRINLVRNYSPHLAPNTRSAPPTAELRKVLNAAAREMLEVFLRRWRTNCRVDEKLGGVNAVDISAVRLFSLKF